MRIVDAYSKFRLEASCDNKKVVRNQDIYPVIPQEPFDNRKAVKFSRRINNVDIEQRVTDGFINGTAMCIAHGKDINQWYRTWDTLELFVALADQMAIPHGFKNFDFKTRKFIGEFNSVELQSLDVTRLSGSKYAKLFPGLIFVKAGSPAIGGGAFLHPDLALQLAQWCNKPFAIQVSRWIHDWMTTGRNPTELDIDQEFMAWQQRYDIRVYLKDFLRPELMNSVVRWSVQNGKSPITFCSIVHDLMNERIQGARSKQIQLLGGLPLGTLVRDYFGASPLVTYSAINKLAKNAIDDRGLDPVQAVHEACDHFLGKAYEPKLIGLEENLYAKGNKLVQARKRKRLSSASQLQLNLWDEGQVS